MEKSALGPWGCSIKNLEASDTHTPWDAGHHVMQAARVRRWKTSAQARSALLLSQGQVSGSCPAPSPVPSRSMNQPLKLVGKTFSTCPPCARSPSLRTTAKRLQICPSPGSRPSAPGAPQHGRDQPHLSSGWAGSTQLQRWPRKWRNGSGKNVVAADFR